LADVVASSAVYYHATFNVLENPTISPQNANPNPTKMAVFWVVALCSLVEV
jgi:hypothetical protein